MKIYIFGIALFSMLAWQVIPTFAQSVIIIPFYKTGENKRLIIEDEYCFRVIETRIQQAFLQQGDFELIDYLAAIRRIENFTDLIRSQKDPITLIIQRTEPDYYIVADIAQEAKPGYQGKTEYSLTLNLKAYRTFDGKSQAGSVLYSGGLHYNSCFGLTTKLFQDRMRGGEDGYKLSIFVHDFLDQIHESLNIPLSVEFFRDTASTLDYYVPLLTDQILAQAISNWIKVRTVSQKVDPDMDSQYLRFASIEVRMDKEQGITSASDLGFALKSYLDQLRLKEAPEEKLNFRMIKSGDKLVFTLE